MGCYTALIYPRKLWWCLLCIAERLPYKVVSAPQCPFSLAAVILAFRFFFYLYMNPPCIKSSVLLSLSLGCVCA